ncbi:hypothetical protein [Streptomyces sp. WMMB303]|uniref:hypothetical protein n=1 Tax=Streptomyces sp. WMMB303 TaxID=3034154 RepID=UPI0023EBD84B|nr:hypothetical protein [Streptomyces sp. WMMB303]MDF4254672.1 hypothetical protein [Streptomyces sp. WMMB303]MDF4254709.1 hypothetical protein [Streptomyces sp. WMMB303]
MASYEDKAKAYIKQAEETVAKVTDPGQKATVYALLALTNAVLETDNDIYRLRGPLTDLSERVS